MEDVILARKVRISSFLIAPLESLEDVIPADDQRVLVIVSAWADDTPSGNWWYHIDQTGGQHGNQPNHGNTLYLTMQLHYSLVTRKIILESATGDLYFRITTGRLEV